MPELYHPSVEHLLAKLESDPDYAEALDAFKAHTAEVYASRVTRGFGVGDLLLAALLSAVVTVAGCVAVVRGWV